MDLSTKKGLKQHFLLYQTITSYMTTLHNFNTIAYHYLIENCNLCLKFNLDYILMFHDEKTLV